MKKRISEGREPAIAPPSKKGNFMEDEELKIDHELEKIKRDRNMIKGYSGPPKMPDFLKDK